MSITKPNNTAIHHDFEKHMRKVFFENKSFTFPLLLKNLTQYNSHIFQYFALKEPDVYNLLGEELFLKIISENTTKAFLTYKKTKEFLFLALTPFVLTKSQNNKINKTISLFFNDLSVQITSSLFIEYAKQHPNYKLFNIFDINIVDQNMGSKLFQYLSLIKIFSYLPTKNEIDNFLNTDDNKKKNFIFNTSKHLQYILFNSAFQKWAKDKNLNCDIFITSKNMNSLTPCVEQAFFIVKDFPYDDDYFQNVFSTFYSHLVNSIDVTNPNFLKNLDNIELSFIQNIDFHLMPYFRQHTLIQYLNEQDNLNNKSESVKSSKKKI